MKTNSLSDREQLGFKRSFFFSPKVEIFSADVSSFLVQGGGLSDAGIHTHATSANHPLEPLTPQVRQHVVVFGLMPHGVRIVWFGGVFDLVQRNTKNVPFCILH